MGSVYVLLSLLAVGGPPRADAAAVAVFADRGFPYFGANQAVSPRIVSEMLGLCGLDARLTDTDAIVSGALRDASVRCLVWCYGNTFPREAEAAITEFHQRGGCLVATGAPFTHPGVRQELGEPYVFVTPSQLARVYRELSRGPAEP